MAATVAGILLSGDHASLPAASSPPVGSLYSCSTHSLIYVTNGSAWSTWATLGETGGIAETLIDAKGDLVVGTASDTAGRLAVGTNDQVLTADSTQASGMKWAAAVGGSVATDTIWDAAGDLAVGTGANTAARLAIGANGTVLTSNGSTATWAAGGGGSATPEVSAAGRIYAYSNFR